MPTSRGQVDEPPVGHGVVYMPAAARVPLDPAPQAPLPLPVARLPLLAQTKQQQPASPYNAYWSPGEAVAAWYDQAGDNQGDYTSYSAHADPGSTAVLNFSQSAVPIDALVINLPVLSQLNISGSKITAFDPSTCPGLTEFYCNNTGITALDISSNATLYTLECGYCPITSLVLNNVSTTAICNNTLITGLLTAPAHYSQLNFSGCAALTSVNVTGSIDFQIVGVNSGVQTVTIASSANMRRCWLRGCALTQATVDYLLHLMVLGGKNRGSALLDLGTSAAPSAAGLADKATLIAAPRLWQVLTN